MQTPLVSVIIPTYNRGRLVLDAVKWVQHQTYENIETIVVVDGSKDDTIQILSDYGETLPASRGAHFRIVAQDNLGVSSARNNGVQNAFGQIIAFLDDDDPWHPEKVARQVSELQKYPADSPILCTTDYRTIDPRTDDQEIIKLEKIVNYERSLIEFPPPSAWLLRRELFEAMGGFDTTLKRGEDSDFLIRLRKTGALFINVTEPLMTYTLPHPGKVYSPSDHKMMAVLLERHGLWYREALPPEVCDKMMAWHQRTLPARLYEKVIEKLNVTQTLACDGEGFIPPSRPVKSDQKIKQPRLATKDI